MKLRCAAVLVLIATGCAVRLPAGFVKIQPNGPGDEEGWRADSPSQYFRADGDFNGDGILDEAVIARRAASDSRYLLLREGSRGRSDNWIVLQEVSNGEGVEAIGPGHQTLYCSGDQDPNAFCPIDLDYDSINLFIYDAAYQVYFWDSKSRKYRSLWGSI